MAYPVDKIANTLLRLADNAEGSDLLTNLKLQKLLYYEQGYHLAQFGTSLFDEEIEAWQYGPVVPEVYDRYSSYGSNVIPPDDEPFDFQSDEELNLFYNVFETYNKFSAVGLMQLTHKESPWRDAYPPAHGKIIPKESIKEYFISLINN